MLDALGELIILWSGENIVTKVISLFIVLAFIAGIIFIAL